MSAGVVLDTCTLLWLAADQARLSTTARQEIAARADALFVSAISAFEIGVKHAKGKLVLPLDPQEWIARALEQHGIHEIAVDARIAVRATQLPLLHSDPCDRMIVATAKLHSLSILTPDPLIAAYADVNVLW